MSQIIQVKNFSKMLPYIQLFEQGVVVTVLLSLCTVVIGFLLALLLTGMRMSNLRPFRFLAVDRNGRLRDRGFLRSLSRFNPLSFLATAYVEILRSTPVIVQIAHQAAQLPVLRLHQVRPVLPRRGGHGHELRRVPL